MKLRVFCLVAITLLFSTVASAQVADANTVVDGAALKEGMAMTRAQLGKEFSELWQKSIGSGLTYAKKKPKVRIEKRNMFGFFAVTEGGTIKLYPTFFDFDYQKELNISPYAAQTFLIAHELGHWLLPMPEPPITYPPGLLPLSQEDRIRGECDADVFAVRLVGDQARDVLRALEAYYLRIGNKIYSQSTNRALLVLEGKRESCGK